MEVRNVVKKYYKPSKEEIRTATREARNLITPEIEDEYPLSDSEYRVLALFIKKLKDNESFRLSGELGSKDSLVSIRQWWIIIKRLEAMEFINVFRRVIGKAKNAVNFYYSTSLLQKFISKSQTLTKVIIKFVRVNTPNVAQIFLTHTMQSVAHTKDNVIYNNNLTLPTTKPKIQQSSRSATPPNAMELSVRVAETENLLLALYQTNFDKAAKDKAESPADEGNRYFWEILTRLDTKLASDLFKRKIGLMDGLSLIRNRFLPDLSFNSFITSLENHQLAAAQMLVGVAYKIKTGEKIRYPAAYYWGALRNPDGARPLLTLSRQFFEASRPADKPQAPHIDKNTIAKAWAKSLGEQERKRFFDKFYHGDSPREIMCDDIRDPIWMVRAYKHIFNGDWSAFNLLKA